MQIIFLCSRLPSEASLRNQWIAKIGRKNWNPSKHTKICSDHFNQEDFFKTAKGFRKIKIGATPSLKLDRTVSYRCSLLYL